MTETFMKVVREGGSEPLLVDRRFSTAVEEIGSFSLRKVVAAISLLLRTKKAIRRFKPDVCVFFITNRPASFLVDVALSGVLMASNLPIINYIHTSGYSELANRSRIWRSLVTRLLGAASSTVCLGDSLVADVRNFVPNADIVVIPNATAVPVNSVASHYVEGERRKVLFLSNMIAEKGPSAFIEMAIQLNELDADFTLAGAVVDPLTHAELKRRVETQGSQSSISFLGALLSEDKWETLQAADILVFPSSYRFEAQPLTILEALAARTAVVAYATGGVADILKGSLAGRTVPTGDLAGLTANVAELIQNKDALEMAKVAAVSLFNERYSEKAFSANWMVVLSKFSSAKSNWKVID